MVQISSFLDDDTKSRKVEVVGEQRWPGTPIPPTERSWSSYWNLAPKLPVQPTTYPIARTHEDYH